VPLFRKSIVGLVIVAAAALTLFGTSAAHAHHVVSEHGVASIMPRTVAAIDVGAASFDFDERKGDWQVVTPSFEWQVFRRFSLFAALPFGRVKVEGRQGAFGLGDLSLSGKLTLVATPHGGFLLSAGLGAEVPTGDADQGFGGGHLELTPFVGASSAFYDSGSLALVVYGMSALRISVGGHEHDHGTTTAADHDELGSVIAPHAEREVYGRAMLAAVIGAIDIGSGGEGAVVLHGEGGGQLGWRSEVGYLATPSLRVSLAIDVTVMGERRYGTRGHLGAAWRF
jgi:hypothetical protein